MVPEKVKTVSRWLRKSQKLSIGFLLHWVDEKTILIDVAVKFLSCAPERYTWSYT